MSKTSNALTIGQVAETIGVSTHTLRYYEQAGLIRTVGRTQAGHRLYSPADLDWLQFVMRLKATGMPVAGMQAFAALRAEGQPTIGARRDLLVAHRDAVLARIAELQTSLGAITDKIAYYEGEAAAQASAADSATRQIDDTSSFSHSEKDSPWTTHKTTATRKAGTN
ncbi:MerR family transcriptional regulator [Paraburkholderia rhynchosiae]|uniref:MerR family transcriptional regulator n=1 Tax=Paraburkholderia rhynchosiae TaxID=487049 RepID=A0A2N7WHL6_9BURK|nr:MerR family transcriptional regulator [Paraburkholderia rhynchosiae]PMS28920.1 MerR family transcriptional regulator [Paraburkholderia rhynchosiae]CAB3666348.1 putative HTH-type transcriptional regulator [Paraburkholderia rhynchosiae]